ncbi:DUF551 domain-containing protein [Enterobacter asburiae]|uniref:DUF551 domain-containing protein n=1 Tax=Enterobacter asburiae TaxID=61645 RepID=UPI001FF18CD1|nr:DUF551 domain-containing protein [Enterobacter asburiae]UOZ20033.1 DUF551 domain-containing protein [Enterobacter asburiae]
MSTITKERAKDILEFGAGRIISPITDDEIMELARIALASLEAVPVGEVSEQRDGLVMDGMVDLGGASTHRIIKGASKMKRLPLGTKFYTAPPAPVALTSGYSDFEEIWSSSTHPLTQDDEMKDFAWDIWNACRAAMLQGAEPVTTVNKLPFEQWLSQQTGTIDVECGCVMTEVFFHWLRVAYEAGNSPVTPDGWVLVPEEPTHEMLEAGDEQFGTYDVYRRMIAATPQQEAKP